jgi:2-(1,2-epoxy-1,2-dihydrophenyl)acetyl-CoA isomerase
MAHPLILDVAAGVARLTLNRPEQGNALNAELGAALRAATSEIEQRDDVRAVVLAAAGKSFCVGGDLAFMEQAGDRLDVAVHGLATDVHAAIQTLVGLPAPVIAAVNGVAAGGGVGLALTTADLVVTASSARFVLAYTAAALTPDCGASWILPRLVGQRRAAELLLTNRQVGAAEALELGRVTQVVEDDRLDEVVAALAATIADGPTAAYGAVKRELAASAAATLADQLALEADEIAAAASGRDGREGIAAFLAKRPPAFTGER